MKIENYLTPFRVRQDGGSISDVALPPWAKGDPGLFTRINAEALESGWFSH